MAYDQDHTWNDIMTRVTQASREFIDWKGRASELFEDLRVYSSQFANNAAIATHLDAKEQTTGTVTEGHIDDLAAALTSMRDIVRLAEGDSIAAKAFLDDLRKFVP